MPHAVPSSPIASASEEVIGPYSSPRRRTRFARLWPRTSSEGRVTPDDSALRVITDFTREQPWTITPDRSVDDALREMVCAGVRALLVVQDDLAIGLITSSDIEGPHPFELLRGSSCRACGEVEVRRIMTPWDRLETLEWNAACAARAGQIEEYFRNSRATHVMLVEHAEHLAPYVRGLISRNRIEREMGRPL